MRPDVNRFCFAQIVSWTAVTLIGLIWSAAALGDEIHDAAQNGDLETVKSLLKANPNLVFRKDDKGETPLLLAAKNDQMDVVAFLLANKADVNTRAKNQKFYGEGFSGVSVGGTPLIWAILRKDEKMVELLLAHGANANANDLGTPLHEAVEVNNPDIAELLLADHADIDATDEDGQTPLHIAAQGRTEMVQWLLSHRANVNVKNNDGDTPLHLAASREGPTDIAELLLARGANINARNKAGDTPLLVAAKYCYGDITMAEFLVAHGADVNAKDKKGYTALSIPKDYLCPKLTELLQAHGATKSESIFPE